MEAANAAPQMVPGLLAWIEHAADWESQRRSGYDVRLQQPDAAIDSSEDAAAIAATGALRGVFVADAPRVAALFGALLDLLMGVRQRQ